MIGRLRGRLILKQPPLLMIELGNGLAYELEASLNTCCNLPDTGDPQHGIPAALPCRGLAGGIEPEQPFRQHGALRPHALTQQ